MKSIITIFAITVLVSVAAIAGKSYTGYVVLNNDEKVEGTIEMLSPSLNEVKVKFTSKDGKNTTYKSKEVKEYGFQVEKWNNETRTHNLNTIVYTRKNVERSPIAFGPTEVLIEREVAGAINMYNHFVEQNSNPQEPFAHILYVEKTNGEMVSLDKDNFKVVLKNMTAEYPELSAKIGTKGYGFKHIAQIVSTYNAWMMNNGEEVVLGMN
jgi:Tfp pilus assembly major pilin PilA